MDELADINFNNKQIAEDVTNLTYYYYNFDEQETTNREAALLFENAQRIGRKTFIAYGQKLKQIAKYNPKITFDKITALQQYFTDSTRLLETSLTYAKMKHFDEYLERVLNYAHTYDIFYNTPEEADLLPKLTHHLTKAYDENTDLQFYAFNDMFNVYLGDSRWKKPDGLGIITSVCTLTIPEQNLKSIQTNIIIFANIPEKAPEITFFISKITSFHKNANHHMKYGDLCSLRLLKTEHAHLLIQDYKITANKGIGTTPQDVTSQGEKEFQLSDIKIQLEPINPNTVSTQAQICLQACAITPSRYSYGMLSKRIEYGWIPHNINITVYNLAAQK